MRERFLRTLLMKTLHACPIAVPPCGAFAEYWVVPWAGGASSASAS